MSTPSSPSDSWITLDEVKAILGSDAPTTPEGDAALQANIDSAVELLYALSGRQFAGAMSSVVRPTSRPQQTQDYRFSQWMLGYGFAFGWNAAWMWGVCSGCQYTGCCGPSMIGLGRSPIISVEQVLIDGGVIDPSEYRIDDAKWLQRQDGCGGWPTCQNLAATTDKPCTFEVSFTWNQDPPQMGKHAAGQLASEFYKADTPGLNCSLPARITSITRQGISFAVLDPQTFMDKGLTGNYQIDMFIKAYNPAGTVRKPMVFSPDVANLARRQTWPTS
jgi:hypothetical protein